MEENERKIICCECGEVLTPDEACEFDGNTYCSSCLDDITFICDCCGEREYTNDEISDERISICQRCYDSYYTRCEGCDRLVHNDDMHYLSDDDDYGYCYDCYN